MMDRVLSVSLTKNYLTVFKFWLLKNTQNDFYKKYILYNNEKHKVFENDVFVLIK